MKIAFKWKEVAVILAVAAFVWVPLIASRWPEIYQHWYAASYLGSVGQPIIDAGKQPEAYAYQCCQNGIIITYGPIALTFLTLTVLVVQACIYGRQAGIMSSQLTATQQTARAAETAANAALAALDRPILMIEDLSFIKFQVDTFAYQFRAKFNLRNYGKAPAVIAGISAALVHSTGRFVDYPFPDKPRPNAIKDFPRDTDALRMFINQYGRLPRQFDTRFEESYTRDNPPLRAVNFEAEILVPSGEPTTDYFIDGQDRFTEIKGAIPLEYAFPVYLIGRLIYFGINNDVETVNFCYEGRPPGGRFSKMYGPPYNERKKSTLPQSLGDHSVPLST